MSSRTADPVSAEQDDPSGRPLLRVVRGRPTAEELAALVTVLTARTAAAAAPEPKPVDRPWTYRRAQLSRPVFVGHGEWRRRGFDKGTRTKADW